MPWRNPRPNHGDPQALREIFKSLEEYLKDLEAALGATDGTYSDSTGVTSGATGVSASADLAAHLADTTDAHDASAVSLADSGGRFVATNVESGLAEVWVFRNTDADTGRTLWIGTVDPDVSNTPEVGDIWGSY